MASYFSKTLFLALAGTVAALMPVHAASLPQLNDQITVNADIVRLGDLFRNAGDKAQVALFRAPDPGHTGSVPVDNVLDMARQHGVVLPEKVTFPSVSVTRSSRFVSPTELSDVLRTAFAARSDQTVADALSIVLDHDTNGFHLPVDIQAPLSVSSMVWNTGTGQFSAVLASGKYTRTLTGTAQDLVSVVVAHRDINRETVLGPEDVGVEQRPRSQVSAQQSLDNDMLVIGKAARRPMRAGQIVANADLIEPEMVKRAAMVTLIHRKPGLVLTARAQALKSGRRGDVITVMNLTSKRMVEGTITGPDEITITSAHSPIAQLNASRK